jgi:hypothetical protein
VSRPGSASASDTISGLLRNVNTVTPFNGWAHWVNERRGRSIPLASTV